MTINYTNKAKEDLIQLDWRLRQKIINTLGKIQQEKRFNFFHKMHNSEYYKVNLSNHLLICSLEENQFNVLTVVEKKEIKFPD